MTKHTAFQSKMMESRIAFLKGGTAHEELITRRANEASSKVEEFFNSQLETEEVATDASGP